jgi:WD40 repeat protein
LRLAPGAAISELPQKLTSNFDRIPSQGVPYETISIVFSPDGTKLAAGWWAGIAKIWDVENGQELFSVQAHLAMQGISRLAFSPDGRLLATVGLESDATAGAKIWDVASGKKISTFSGHDPRYTIESIVFSPDSEHVATASGDGLKIWDAKTGEESLEMVGQTIPVVGVDFSPDGKYLATSSPDGTVRKWDLSSGEELVVYRTPAGPLFDVKITPDGKKIIVSGAGYVIGYIFDLDETINLAHSRLTRWFTREECRKYLHLEECPLPSP